MSGALDQEQSAQTRAAAAAAERLLPEAVKVFDRSIPALVGQGLPAQVVRVGDTLEPFTLNDATARRPLSAQLVAAGPAVVVL